MRCFEGDSCYSQQVQVLKTDTSYRNSKGKVKCKQPTGTTYIVMFLECIRPFLDIVNFICRSLS